jgi:lathosterol oxidase
MSLVVDIVLMLAVLDTYLYWIHRAMHRIPWLWNIHKVHHAEYAPNFHLLEFSLLWLVPMTVAWLFSYNLAIYIIAFLFVYEVTLTHRTVYSTSNRVHKVLFRSVKSFVGNAKFHKVHHDRPNRNYTQMFTFWDRIMGTIHRSESPANAANK